MLIVVCGNPTYPLRIHSKLLSFQKSSNILQIEHLNLWPSEFEASPP